MSMEHLGRAWSVIAAALVMAAGAFAAESHRPFRAADVFDLTQPIIFHDDFSSGRFGRWNFSEDDRYRLTHESPDRIRIVEAPGLAPGHKAACFVVPRGPNSFRAEVSLPHEPAFTERWYSERILVPRDWVFDATNGNDLVMQWHAIPGNWRATFPNLEISIVGKSWVIRQSFGSAQTRPTRTSTKLADPVEPGAWVSWVVHAKWSPGDDGIIQAWKDRKLVLDRKGPNVYTTIGVQYTPYLKTGIYHPQWHLDTDAKRRAFAAQKPADIKRVIYVTDVKVGSERADFSK